MPWRRSSSVTKMFEVADKRVRVKGKVEDMRDDLRGEIRWTDRQDTRKKHTDDWEWVVINLSLNKPTMQ